MGLCKLILNGICTYQHGWNRFNRMDIWQSTARRLSSWILFIEEQRSIILSMRYDAHIFLWSVEGLVLTKRLRHYRRYRDGNVPGYGCWAIRQVNQDSSQYICQRSCRLIAVCWLNQERSEPQEDADLSRCRIQGLRCCWASRSA